MIAPPITEMSTLLTGVGARNGGVVFTVSQPERKFSEAMSDASRQSSRSNGPDRPIADESLTEHSAVQVAAGPGTANDQGTLAAMVLRASPLMQVGTNDAIGRDDLIQTPAQSGDIATDLPALAKSASQSYSPKNLSATGKLSSTSVSDRRSSKDEAVTNNQQILSVPVPVVAPLAKSSLVRLPLVISVQPGPLLDQLNPIHLTTPLAGTSAGSFARSQVAPSQSKPTNNPDDAKQASSVANEIAQSNDDGIDVPAIPARVARTGPAPTMSTSTNVRALEGTSTILKAPTTSSLDGKVLKGGSQSELGRSVNGSSKASAIPNQNVALEGSSATTAGVASIKGDEQAAPNAKAPAIHSENVSVSKETLQVLVSKAMNRASDLPASPSFTPSVEVGTSRKSDDTTKTGDPLSTEAGLSFGQRVETNVAANMAVNSVTPASMAGLGASFKENTKVDAKPVSVSVSANAKQGDSATGGSGPTQTKDTDASTSEAIPQARSGEDQNVVITQGALVGHVSSQDSGGHSIGTTASLLQPTPVQASSGKQMPEVALRAGGEAGPTPAALPAINTAKVIQSMGQTEMRVGMNSTEFGNISIRTSTTRDAIVAQISLDHGDLAKELTVHLPEIQEKLSSVAPANVRIDLTGSSIGQGSGTSSGMSNGSANNPGTSRQQQNDNGGRGVSSDVQGWPTSQGIIAAVTNEGVPNRRLDINI